MRVLLEYQSLSALSKKASTDVDPFFKKENSAATQEKLLCELGCITVLKHLSYVFIYYLRNCSPKNTNICHYLLNFTQNQINFSF